ncbi:MAG: Ribosomal protein L21e [Candidatus Parvarchaeum acidiphilum ARMAN-4]|jgi:large subunit ribosomal protein L21e|uniref:Ribosomal protein L21e n=1 Tax=Candidatus Parvarchaeum acidiphilum ARMAN-4 TaxID=662760 RepID=D2EFU5_PARA4|nr:MAG: Ribosomal protein L21e [Candidatus Parvarchaeum acidiphilum ARMAN-4]MCL5976000.1 50S ribosomal protein L21e [Candidatus Parvarchaeota archaeon]
MSITGNGLHRRSRKRLKLDIKERGKVNIKKALQSFEVGDKVIIDPDSRIQRNLPQRSFFGSVGKIIEKKGKAYTVEVKQQGKSLKRIDLLPVHIKRL